MKTNAIIRIILFSLVLLLLLAVLIVGIGAGRWFSGFGFRRGLSDGAQSSQGVVPADQIRKLDIQWISGNIRILPGDGADIIFRESGPNGQDTMIWKQSGDTLTIQFGPTRGWLGIQADEPKDLEVTVPRDWLCRELEIESVSAELQVQDILFEELSLENVSGRCDFLNCQGDSAELATVSGRVTYTGQLQELEAETVSADITFQPTNSPRSISLDSVSGDLRLTLPADCAYDTTISTMSGHISEHGQKHQGHHSQGSGGCHISADTVSGSVIFQ